jgi:predicted Rossmann-fold nucleotide-binding protein
VSGWSICWSARCSGTGRCEVALVRQLATSGAWLQLAIAPAGAGKTTAMRTLAAAWTEAGGTVIGFAPSAAAAAQLRDQINVPTLSPS